VGGRGAGDVRAGDQLGHDRPDRLPVGRIHRDCYSVGDRLVEGVGPGVGCSGHFVHDG
jgi:hypothetical protein